MEDTLGDSLLACRLSYPMVLILVLMEDTLGVIGLVISLQLSLVLILVLMEDTLGAFLTGTEKQTVIPKS